MDIYDQMLNRELGEFPISYGSAMPILLVMDANSESNSKERAKDKPDELWINLSTLTRNVENVLDRKLLPKVTGELMARVLLDEITKIVNELRRMFNDKLKVVFYQSNYNFLLREFPRAKIRTPPKSQADSVRIEKQTLEIIEKPLKEFPER